MPLQRSIRQTGLLTIHKRAYLPLGRTLMPALLLTAFVLPAYAIGGKSYVRFDRVEGGLPLTEHGRSAPLCVSGKDYPGVLRILKDFQDDIAKVTGARPEIAVDTIPHSPAIVIVGTVGRSGLIDRLVQEKKIDVQGIAGAWETFLIQPIDNPFRGVRRALVIAGSDKRGTIYGMFDISERIGVSPWYWWADVPAQRHVNLYILPGRHTAGPPSVKYRGIFLNDEAPDLTNWVAAKYGRLTQGEHPPIPPGIADYGHAFYARIFELLLRLKANYLWPAMWDNAFNEDDQENPKLADEFGIVMGTSHQEPMLRAQKEWDRRYLGTLGVWNYAKEPDTLENFWREGIRRNKAYESVITIGLRGANDTPMAPGGPEANMALLEKIVGVQRNILANEMNADVTRVPQLWCLYKEVLGYYDAGMRVPDDVTLLWPDDNWGDLRRLPTAEERARSGGAGIYYHFDYHGGPRSYQWINTNPIAKIWDQMSLAKQYGADKIWIVNVGHFKGYEFPVGYFMDLAWDVRRWTNSNIGDYTRLWAEREFGARYAGEIADIVTKYTRYNGRRKPELLRPTTYSLVNYREAETVVAEFKEIASKAVEISRKLPENEKDAFYELVLFPARASALVNELYLAAGENSLYARQKRSATNLMAAETRRLFAADTSLMGEFNRTFAHGKWDHFMDQPHLGYTGWRDPSENSLKAVDLVELDLPEASSLGVAVEGSEAAWPGSMGDPVLPPFDRLNRQRRYIEVFNRGKTAFTYRAKADKPWLELAPASGELQRQARMWVALDRRKAPAGTDSGTVTITGAQQEVRVHVRIADLHAVARPPFRGFVESDGCVSMEAEHYTGKSEAGDKRWMRIEDYGHTLSAMRAASDVDAPPAEPGKNSPCLEYRMYLVDSGRVDVEGVFSATLNFAPGRGLRYGISFDNEPPQVVTLVPPAYTARDGNSDWEQTVEDNARHSSTSREIGRPGPHTLKVWMVDPGVVLEKIVVNCGGVRPSYLGPPESYYQGATKK